MSFKDKKYQWRSPHYRWCCNELDCRLLDWHIDNDPNLLSWYQLKFGHSYIESIKKA